jgi:heme oxygenase
MSAKLTPQQRKRLIKEFGHIPTKKELFAKIQESQETMLKALEEAYKNLPDDPDIRGQFIEALERTSKLHKKLNELKEEK